MTTDQITQLLRVAEAEIRERRDVHPEIEGAASGSACILRAGLASAAEMHVSDWVVRYRLADAAQIAAENLSVAILRRPHISEATEPLWNVAMGLAQIADYARAPAVNVTRDTP